jgi:TPR repeat protein
MKSILAALLLAAGLLCPHSNAQQDDAARKQFLEIKPKAEQGNAQAQSLLGIFYYKGISVEKDCAEAVKWFRKAAEQGNAQAQSLLGLNYYQGTGVEKDYAEALRWYRKAAEQSDALAQFSLGVCYDEGRGVEKDEVEAVKWYRKAAGQGNALAQRSLGIGYDAGIGVDKDYVEAYAWYNLASTMDKDAAKGRDAVEEKMSPQQVAAAQKRTKELRAIIEANEKAKAAK